MPLRGRLNLVEERFYFVTTTVVEYTNVFTSDVYSDILVDIIKYYREKFNFEILAYVIMPSHFHWIVEVNPEFGTISDIMRDIKKSSAWKILEELTKNNSPLLNIFERNAKGYSDQNKKFWMKRFDDVVIRNEKNFWEKFFYIHQNPVKAGLVRRMEDYKYSSARNYFYNDHSVLPIDIKTAGIKMY